ncbi:ROK family transcriptional regulator [Bacillus sp. V3-13]|nr:ROK family transcriptional regulator [Bacillus sp. V3-13]
MKKINRSLILDTIRSHQPLSRAQIAQRLKLSRSTVSSIVEELLLKKLVVELGYGSSTSEGGRRGLQLGFNPKSAFGIGLDIGGTKILVVITDLDGSIEFREKFPTTSNTDKIIEIIKQSIHKAGLSESDVIAMGVGVPGITTKDGIVVDAPALKWTNLELKSEMQANFDFPVFINNDVNCAALGERWLGSGENSDDIFFIAIGTGVGSAIVANGELIQGFDSRAGEIAYNISETDIKEGQENKLGEFGVFEKKISGSALQKHCNPPERLFTEYAKGSKAETEIIENFILQLSINIANVVNLLNPEFVIIGGGVSESMGVVIEKIQESVERLTPIKTKIGLATLGGDAGGLGAIAYAFKEIEGFNMLGD